MKAKIYQSGTHEVTAEYDDVMGERVERVFWIAQTTDETAYVREGDSQVCDALASTGDTLRAAPNTLIDVIRKEYRAMKREWAREGF